MADAAHVVLRLVRRDRRAGRSLALLLACAVAAVLTCAGPALAAPGLVELGGSQIGPPAGDEVVRDVAVHGDQMYAGVIQGANGRSSFTVQRFDQRLDTWQQVGHSLNDVDRATGRPVLLSTRKALYAAWTQFDVRTRSSRVLVARMTPDGAGWERVMEAPSDDDRVRLAEAGDEVWVAWQRAARVRLARIVAGRVEPTPADLVPPNSQLDAVVGYGTAAYLAYHQTLDVPAHRDNDSGEEVPARSFQRLHVARLRPVPGGAGVELTDRGAWDHAQGVFFTAGGPESPIRPILGWNTINGVELMQLREDGGGFGRIPIEPLVRLRSIRRLRGLTATPAGITIAANGGGGGVRLYTIMGPPARLAITDGEELPEARTGDDVAITPAPRPAADGALVLGYNVQGPLGYDFAGPRAAALRYSP